MSDYEAIVVRKRRRKAIDPSLGYYIANKANSPERSKSLNTAVIVPSPMPADSKNGRMRTPTCLVTVDDFLRVQKDISSRPQKKYKSENQNTRRDYLRLRSRTVTRTEPSDSNSQGSQLSTKFSHSRRKRRFKQRIYEAAIATCVDPIRTLAQPVDTPQSRLPLHFETVDPLCVRNVPVTERKLRVVNPLKPSCFAGSRGHSEQRLPMTRWQVPPPLNTAQREDHNSPEASHRLTGDEQAQLMAPPPLDFVPLSRAETAYRIMFPPPLQQ